MKQENSRRDIPFERFEFVSAVRDSTTSVSVEVDAKIVYQTFLGNSEIWDASQEGFVIPRTGLWVFDGGCTWDAGGTQLRALIYKVNGVEIDRIHDRVHPTLGSQDLSMRFQCFEIFNKNDLFTVWVWQNGDTGTVACQHSAIYLVLCDG